MWETGRQTAQVMFIIAMAAPFGWVLIQQQIPNAILQSLFALSSEPWVILLIVNVVLLVLGMFLEGDRDPHHRLSRSCCRSWLQIGVDPVHFGVIMVLNLMIGLVTPPVGLCLYVVSSVIAQGADRGHHPRAVALPAGADRGARLVTYVPAVVALAARAPWATG